jgi:hypothetical protein
MIYMLFGKLFWDKETDSKIMSLKKEQLTNVPQFLRDILQNVRLLDFDECPDYGEIINVFEKVFKELGFNEEDE